MVNIIVLRNALCMDTALTHFRAEGFGVRDDDVARRSSSGFKHTNMLGRYAFTLSDVVARGELRSLRDPTAQVTDADEPTPT